MHFVIYFIIKMNKTSFTKNIENIVLNIFLENIDLADNGI